MKVGEKMRTPMVTRTFRATEVKGLFVNVSTKETFEETFTLSRPLKSERDILKMVNKTGMFTDEKKLVTILDFANKSVKYAMSESDFIAHADVVTD